MKRIPITSSFFKRFFLISCLIGILPLLLLGYLSYNKSASIVEEEVTAGNEMILQQNKAGIESVLKTVDTLTTQTIASPVNTSAVSMATALDLPYHYNHAKVFESLIKKLVQIQVYELGVNDVHLISFRQDWLVEGGVVYPMQDRSSNNKRNDDLHRLKQQLIGYRDDLKRSYWKLAKNGETDFFLKLIKHIPLHSSEPYGLITVNIPLTEISERLTGGEQLGTVMILNSSGTVLAHSDTNQIGTSVRDVPYYQELIIQEGRDGFFTIDIEEEKYVVIFNHSGYNDWTYVSLTPLEHLTEKSNTIKWYTVFAIGLIILLVVLASIVFSFRMYSPIRKIYQFMKPENKKLQGNELQYISEQVRDMMHSQNRMAGEIENLNMQASVSFVIKLLQGEIKTEELEENFEKYGFPVDWDHWCLISIQIDPLDDTPYADRDRDLLMFAVQNMVEEIIPMQMRLRPVVQKQYLFMFIGVPLGDTKPFEVTVFNIVETVQQRVKYYLKLNISIGISRTYKEFIHASLAYQESLDALTYRIRLGQESILFIDKAQPEKHDYFRYPRDLEFHMLEAVRQLDKELARDRLKEMIMLFFEKHVNHYDYHVFLGRLLNNLTGVVQDAGASVQDVFQKEIFKSDIWMGMHSPTEIQDWFEQHVLIPLLNWIEEKKKNQDINISEEVINTIHQDYDKDLSIDLFASRLNFHPNYISRVFKKETGQTFTEYLSQYRMEIAKRWLKETDMKISDIAEKLRYSTASNFNRNFKKMLNLTPSQYRKQQK